LPCLAIFRSAVPCSLSLPSSPTRRSSDLDGGALRYRGVDIEELVEKGVTFGDVWALLVDGEFGRGLHPAEPFPLPIHTGDVRVRSEEHTSELQSRENLVCRLLLEKKTTPA